MIEECDIGSIDPTACPRAMDLLKPWVHRTPVFTSRTLDELTGAKVFLKCENLQRAGAFKFRGAMHAILELTDEERSCGVVTHSSGNHAQALALAGKLAGVKVCVVMPRTAPAVKRAATAGYGATIVSCEPTLISREETVSRLIAEEGYSLVHPFDDWRVIAGQSTAAWELLDQAGPFDVLITPVGGGGLAAGSALALEARSSNARLIGAEPAAADDAKRSLELGSIQPSGDPKTIADGLRTSLGKRPFSVIRRRMAEIVTSTDAELVDAMQFIWERLKIVIEPSSAVVIAPLLRRDLDIKGRRVGAILSGGNVDLAEVFEAMKSRAGEPSQLALSARIASSIELWRRLGRMLSSKLVANERSAGLGSGPARSLRQPGITRRASRPSASAAIAIN